MRIGSFACVLILLLGMTGAYAQALAEQEWNWHDARQYGIEGQGWQDPDLAAPYDRLPARAEPLVRPAIWRQSRYPSGLVVRFVSDSPRLAARWRLDKTELGTRYSPPGAVSGLDLYVRDGGQWRWVAVGIPTARQNEVILTEHVPEGTREYLLYLPLLNAVAWLQVGIAPSASLHPAPPRATGTRPMLFYGTSITHGVGASRAGMTYPALLGRWFDVEAFNMGYGGNALMDLELVEFLAEPDASVYVLDPIPNMSPKLIEERYAAFVKGLRALRPNTPIVLVGRISPSNLWFSTRRSEQASVKEDAVQQAWAALRKEEVPGLHFVPADGLRGEDGEDTMDGVHPTDLGYLRYAESLRPVLAPLLANRDAAE